MYHPGTVSSLKQILQNGLMKRTLQHHSCIPHIHYSSEKKGKECNNLIYTYTDSEYQFYNIIDPLLPNPQKFLCHPQGRFKYENPLTPNIEWETIGVFSQGPISSEKVWVDKTEVKGKIILVDTLLITCPTNILVEK